MYKATLENLLNEISHKSDVQDLMHEIRPVFKTQGDWDKLEIESLGLIKDFSNIESTYTTLFKDDLILEQDRLLRDKHRINEAISKKSTEGEIVLGFKLVLKAIGKDTNKATTLALLLLPVKGADDEETNKNIAKNVHEALDAHYQTQFAFVVDRVLVKKSAPLVAHVAVPTVEKRALKDNMKSLLAAGAVIFVGAMAAWGLSGNKLPNKTETAHAQSAQEQPSNTSAQTHNVAPGESEISDEEVHAIAEQIDYTPKMDSNGQPIFDDEYYQNITRQTMLIGLKQAGVDLSQEEQDQAMQCFQPHS